MHWNDLDDIVREFDRTWGQCSAAAGTPVSMQISRHFVLHYLEPTTRAIVAELDGRFMGVTLSRVAGEPLAFPQAKQELAAINGELNRSTLGAKTLSETEQWHEMELRMEREIDINDVARGEIELFLVAKSARGHGVGGSLWRQAMDYFANCQVARFYLHTDSSCDVSFYDHKGLNCIAARYAATIPRMAQTWTTSSSTPEPRRTLDERGSTAEPIRRIAVAVRATVPHSRRQGVLHLRSGTDCRSR